MSNIPNMTAEKGNTDDALAAVKAAFEQAKTLKAPLTLFAQVVDMSNEKYSTVSLKAQHEYLQKHIDLANLIWENRFITPLSI
jgi:hypothetical protein|tara:strand:+ start:1553 stop:1801 length:249 start_codon:yes stop_codon:yes gene_type:complete